MHHATFAGFRCHVRHSTYLVNNRTALILTDVEDGADVAVATVNVPSEPLKPGEIILKTWSENDGILEALTEAGIVADTGRRVPCGHTEGVICRLLVRVPVFH